MHTHTHKDLMIKNHFDSIASIIKYHIVMYEETPYDSYVQSHSRISSRFGQRKWRILRGPTRPSWRRAQSASHSPTAVTRSGDTGGPIPDTQKIVSRRPASTSARILFRNSFNGSGDDVWSLSGSSRHRQICDEFSRSIEVVVVL